MTLFIILIISISFNIASLYGLYNSVVKLENQEDYINTIYERIIKVLADMRSIDEKEMFERDDEVGILFNELTLILGELRYIVYGTESEEEI